MNLQWALNYLAERTSIRTSCFRPFIYFCHALYFFWTLPVENIDICICPGSVFDRNGGRIGYGGGYYDRFLAKEELFGILKIGLCFGFQLFDNIDQKKHDIKMDYIFTEEDVVKAS